MNINTDFTCRQQKKRQTKTNNQTKYGQIDLLKL